jgi:hypothetical protein
MLGQQFIFEATTCIYHYNMFLILGWVCFGLWHSCNIFVTHVMHILLFKIFYFLLAPSYVSG